MLNTQNFNWKRFFSLEGPLTRLHASFVNMGAKKYVIGGGSFPENLVLNEIWSLSFGNSKAYVSAHYFETNFI